MFVIMHMVTNEVDSVWDMLEQAIHRLNAIQDGDACFALFALIES